MTNLETRILEHYTREDHPSVFELLDMVKEYAAQDEGWCDLETRAELWQQEVARLRAAIEEAAATLRNDLYKNRVDNTLSILDEVLEKPDD